MGKSSKSKGGQDGKSKSGKSYDIRHGVDGGRGWRPPRRTRGRRPEPVRRERKLCGSNAADGILKETMSRPVEQEARPGHWIR